MDPVTLSLVIAFAVVVALSALLVIRRMGKTMKLTMKPITFAVVVVLSALLVIRKMGKAMSLTMRPMMTTVTVRYMTSVVKIDQVDLGDMFSCHHSSLCTAGHPQDG